MLALAAVVFDMRIAEPEMNSIRAVVTWLKHVANIDEL